MNEAKRDHNQSQESLSVERTVGNYEEENVPNHPDRDRSGVKEIEEPDRYKKEKKHEIFVEE